MMRVSLKRIVYILFFVFVSVFSSGEAQAESLHGDLPTGLVQLDDYQYPVYLYVPEKYTPDKKYPLIVTVPGEGESPEENIKFWLSVAKRKSMMVLAPSNLWPQDTPYRLDEWFLKVKRDIANRYHVADTRTFLVGMDEGAHYASYLGTNYPEEFSAVALLGGSWVGKYEKLLKLRSDPARQLPFYVAFRGDQQALLEETRSKAGEFEKKGYLVYLDSPRQSEQGFDDSDYKKEVLSWTEEYSAKWQDIVKEKQKSLKEKIRTWFKNFISL